MYKSKWTTFNDDGTVKYFDEPKPLDSISIENMNQIEKYTDYEFDNTDKIQSIVNEVSNEASNSFSNVESVFSNIGQGIKNGSKVFKYLPFIALGVGALYIYPKVVQNG